MKRRTTTKDWLPVAGRETRAGDPTGDAFRPEWIDFERGIRVGRLEPQERITQILRYHLERSYGTRFITDRWGRGMYWQWICWLPRANKQAKPYSSGVNFGCAKLYISPDRDERVFEAGLQVERGFVRGSTPFPGCRLKKDWDWHRLVAQANGRTALGKELRRLLKREGFHAHVSSRTGGHTFQAKNFRGAGQIGTALRKCSTSGWAGFQLYYPMPEDELRGCTGQDLVKAVFAAFREVVPAMNACMQIELVPREPTGFRPRAE